MVNVYLGDNGVIVLPHVAMEHNSEKEIVQNHYMVAGNAHVVKKKVKTVCSEIVQVSIHLLQNVKSLLNIVVNQVLKHTVPHKKDRALILMFLNVEKSTRASMEISLQSVSVSLCMRGKLTRHSGRFC